MDTSTKLVTETPNTKNPKAGEKIIEKEKIESGMVKYT